MTETKTSFNRESLKTPRSAALAGIIFALLYGTSMVPPSISLTSESVARLYQDEYKKPGRNSCPGL